MGLIKPVKVEKVNDVIISHTLTGGGYLSIKTNREFDDLIDMLRDDILPDVLLILTDEEEVIHKIRVTDIVRNSTNDVITMCAFSKGYYLEFALNSDGTYSRTVKQALAV